MTLKEARQRKGWTQQRLAEETNIPRVTVTKYETGQLKAENMSLELAYKLADALHCEPREFLH